MQQLPTQCRARMDAIKLEAEALLEQFENGNRNYVFSYLLEYSTREALAILSFMMWMAKQEHMRDLMVFMTEVA